MALPSLIQLLRTTTVIVLLHAAVAVAAEPAVPYATAARALDAARNAAWDRYYASEAGKALKAAKDQAEKKMDSSPGPDFKVAEEASYAADWDYYRAGFRLVWTDPAVVAAEAELLRADGKGPPLDPALKSAAPGSPEAARRHKTDAALVFARRLADYRQLLDAMKNAPLDARAGRFPVYPLMLWSNPRIVYRNEAERQKQAAAQEELVRQAEADLAALTKEDSAN